MGWPTIAHLVNHPGLDMKAFLAPLILLLAAGCASEVVRNPAVLSPAGGAARPQLEIAQDTDVQASAGYNRVLPAGSRWQLVGTIPEGDVYRRANGVFTVEGAHVHEAYLVVAGDRLVGFYLPVEKAYSPATPVSLKVR